jgi:hypothetical protein
MMASTVDAWQEPDSTTGCAPWMRGPGRQVALELGSEAAGSYERVDLKLGLLVGRQLR